MSRTISGFTRTLCGPPVRKIPFLDLQPAYRELQYELDSAVTRVAASGWYLLGDELQSFEREYSAYLGTSHCVGVGNGLDAMSLVLRAWGVGAGDEVIVPSNTYIATWLAVTAVGARIVPVEPDPQTYCIERDAIQAAMTSRTRVVLPVHLYGIPADIPTIMDLCRSRGVRVLDDAAQAHGASVGGHRIGSLADATAWSFYPTKNLGAFGDAGAITTNDASLALKLRVLRNYGSREKYVNEVRGVNSRLDEIQAAILRVKLSRLDEWNRRRSALASLYTERLAETPVLLPRVPAGRVSAWHIYPVRVHNREKVRKELARQGVDTLIHYPIPPHEQHAYTDCGIALGSFPVSEAIHKEILSLPIGPHLTPEDANYVVDALTESLAN